MAGQGGVRMGWFVLAALGLVVGCGTGEGGGAALTAPGPCASPVAFRELGRGMLSGFPEEHIEVAQDAEAWAALWRRHEPERPSPAVDFTREQALLVVRPHLTGGYVLALGQVCVGPGAVTVEVIEHAPGPDDVTIQVLTQPWVGVALPRTRQPVVVNVTVSTGTLPPAAGASPAPP